jgi:hypothetical protein
MRAPRLPPIGGEAPLQRGRRAAEAPAPVLTEEEAASFSFRKTLRRLEAKALFADGKPQFRLLVFIVSNSGCYVRLRDFLMVEADYAE